MPRRLRGSWDAASRSFTARSRRRRRLTCASCQGNKPQMIRTRLVACIAGASLVGGGSQPPTSTPAILPAATQAARDEVAGTVRSYFADLQNRDAHATVTLTVPGDGNLPTSTDKTYASLTSARNSQVTSVDSVGGKLVAHVAYDSSGSHYLTNFILKQVGDRCLIESIRPPTKTAPPKSIGAGASKKH